MCMHALTLTVAMTKVPVFGLLPNKPPAARPLPWKHDVLADNCLPTWIGLALRIATRSSVQASRLEFPPSRTRCCGREPGEPGEGYVAVGRSLSPARGYRAGSHGEANRLVPRPKIRSTHAHSTASGPITPSRCHKPCGYEYSYSNGLRALARWSAHEKWKEGDWQALAGSGTCHFQNTLIG